MTASDEFQDKNMQEARDLSEDQKRANETQMGSELLEQQESFNTYIRTIQEEHDINNTKN